MCITISDSYVPPESIILATVCKQLRVYNTGNLSNHAVNASMDFFTDPDDCANIYLEDGSPIICRNDGGTKKCYFTVYDDLYGSDHALRQISPFYVDWSNSDYRYAEAEFITGDTAIGFIVKYYTPTNWSNCGFIIQKLYFWNRTETAINDVAVGEVLDWDIPSNESDIFNESWSDPTRNLIYQTCGGCWFSDQCDSLLECDRAGGIASQAGRLFKNYMTLENDVYIYTSGPFGFEAPLPDDTLYSLMTGRNGFYTASLDSCEDLFTLVTYDIYDLNPNDTHCVVNILATSEDDPAVSNLKAQIDYANAFMNSHAEIPCWIIPDTCDQQKPGDADGNGSINFGDMVYILQYLCTGGPPPNPRANGDPNGDCIIDTTDIVYLSDLIFGSGPWPVECTCVNPGTGSCSSENLCTNSWCDPAFVVCPGGDTPFRVYLRDVNDNPVVGISDVQVEFMTCQTIESCPNSTQQFTTINPVAPSDANGMLTFFMDGGKCDNMCAARIVTYECILDTVPVKALDINGDFVVSIRNDFNFSSCNDYNGDGIIDFNDVNVFNAHVAHSCDIDPCDLFGYQFRLNPESNLMPGQNITLELALSNNNVNESCYIGFVGFFYSQYGTGFDEELIETVPFNSTLDPGEEALITIPYTIPPQGHGCLYAKFTTDCCGTPIELTRCFQSTMHCKPDSNVCYEMHITLNTVPVLDAIWRQFIPAGWTLDLLQVPSFPLYFPDTIAFLICTPNLSDLGDSASVIFTACYNEDCTDFEQFENRVVITSQTGDVNNDCYVNVGDAVYLISYIFKFGPAPVPLASGDTNCDGEVNVGDAVTVINYVFKGGPQPCLVE